MGFCGTAAKRPDIRHHLSRRDFVLSASASALTILGGAKGAAAASLELADNAPSSQAASPQVHATRIDVHGHTVPGLTADRVKSLMDLAGISRMVLMARGRNDALTTEISEQLPNRILPFVSAMYPGWHRQDERVLPRAERGLNSGLFRGVGEVMLRYYGIPSKNEPAINVPADSPFIKRLADIVRHHDAVMLVHMEPEPEAVASLENLLNYNKGLKLIWAHCGTIARVAVRTVGHADIGALMDRHPNLYTDIAGVQPRSLAPSGGLRRPPIADIEGSLYPRFRRVIERHNDRVLFGLDTPWAQCWSEEPFQKWVAWADRVVSQFDDIGIADRIMRKNAEKLFRL